jgi:hypothetical protein
MAVVVEICELVGPLRDYAQGIFEESNDDEEAADAREVAKESGLAGLSSGQRGSTTCSVQRAALTA